MTSAAGATGNGQGNGGSELTASTVFTTRTATIMACPSSVTNCPARSRTTYLTTETIVAYTTICPAAEATGAHVVTTTHHVPSAAATGVVGNVAIGGSEVTTSTILTTRTTTITACPSSVTNCPARLKTVQPATETLVIGTTVYSIAKQPAVSSGGKIPDLITSTILSTRVATVTACAADDSNCYTSQGSYLTTETLVIATTVLPVTSIQTSIPTKDIDAVTAAPMATAVPQGAAVGIGSSPSNEGVDTTYTTTITVDSCSSDGTCTAYVSTITMTKTEVAQSTITATDYNAGNNFGFGASHAPSIISVPVIPQSSQHSRLSTSIVPSESGSGVDALYTNAASVVPSRSSSAVGALYTGAASVGAQWSMLRIVGTFTVLLVAMFV
uniref:Uncharacterized protein n=1 Tax=Aspergillus homomorphus (strain CBS 101889) TaxID=1450537 RepID=A0A395HRP5_ASPHC|nr:hypothetical protein BO97DRAFT_426694 [Aspergillus homomorphus CBS 101889]RAL10169.1 hypothetical protein BO97DRAFT_426694 [Aspergillus homomorphus CBS 101889]